MVAAAEEEGEEEVRHTAWPAPEAKIDVVDPHRNMVRVVVGIVVGIDADIVVGIVDMAGAAAGATDTLPVDMDDAHACGDTQEHVASNDDCGVVAPCRKR